ncbi:radical SAM protein [Candidatus Fermentibacteria bacterium]|nr:radical SAM protein [Candidatus Fermentibacteria bacterium]
MMFSKNIRMTDRDDRVALQDIKSQKGFLLVTRERYNTLCNNMLHFHDEEAPNDELLDKLIENEWVLEEQSSPCEHGYLGQIHNLHIEPTMNCNLNCKYCLRDSQNGGSAKILFADFEDHVIPFINMVNASHIGFIGGEPTVHPDFDKMLYLTLSMTNCRMITVYSNGIHLNSRIIDLITDSQSRTRIQISIDGYQRETNDAIRGEGTYDKIMSTLDMLYHYRLRNIQLKMTITPYNANEYPMLYKFAKDRNWRITISMFSKLGRGNSSSFSYTTMNKVLAETMVEFFENPTGFDLDYHTRSPNYFSVYPCGLSSKGSAVIDSECNLLDCMKIRRIAGDIRRNPQKALQKYYRFFFPTVDTIPGCSTCDLRYLCAGGCRGLAYDYSGHIVGNQPYCSLCKVIYGNLLWQGKGAR